MTVTPLPFAKQVEGLRLIEQSTAAPSTHRIEMQYTARTPQGEQWYSLQMPLLQALYLLNLLEMASRDNGFDHLRRPPEGMH